LARAPLSHYFGDDFARGADARGVQFDFGKFLFERIPNHLQIAHGIRRVDRHLAFLLGGFDDIFPACLR
jgi:hypothetical protein